MCARAEEGTSRLLTDDPVSVSMTSLSTLKALTQGGTLRSMFWKLRRIDSLCDTELAESTSTSAILHAIIRE